MRIDTNSIGNYSPNSIAKPRIEKTVQQTQAQKLEDITSKEKQFFTGLFPEQSGDVMDYHFYKRSGQMSGVKLGSLFDRKG